MSNVFIEVADDGVTLAPEGVQPRVVEVAGTGPQGPQGPQGEQGPQGPQGPRGLPGDAEGLETKIHDQQVASSHWIIEHDWPGGFPSVTVVATDGTEMVCEKRYVSEKRVDCFFYADGQPVPVAGKAFLN